MAIGLQEVNNKSKKGTKSLLEIILERNETSHLPKKEKVLRPWQLHKDSITQYQEKKRTIMSPFEKDNTVLNGEEIMKRKIRKRAKELFKNISDFF